MKSKRIRSQRGASRLVNFLTVLTIVVGGYWGIRLGPLYIEKYRIDNIVTQAANQWVNVTPNVEEIRRDVNRKLKDAQVNRVSADRFVFDRFSESEVQVSVKYKVTLRHPWGILKPTKLDFRVSHRAKRVYDM